MHHQAIAAYNTAVELKPDLVDALTNLGVAHAGVGNLSEAVRWLSQAVRINPQYYQAQYNLGVAYDMAGDREKAQRHFEKARAIRGE
jgi:Flp pilus assembly protein TadD